MSKTIYRQWLILKSIPKYPQTITSSQLLKKVNDEEGYETTPRTIQRSLNTLRDYFPFIAEEQEGTNYWFWIKGADAIQNIPGVDPATALTFTLVESYLAPLLPRSSLNLLQPYFDQAKRVLENTTDNRFLSWPNKIAVINPGIKLRSPVIDPGVQQVIYEALLYDKQLKAQYLKREAIEPENYVIHPLSIVFQSNIIYLVCMIENKDNIRHLPLHRFLSVEITYNEAKIPEKFDLLNYINDQNQFLYVVDPKPIKLKLKFNKCAVVRLKETPISDDQKITELPNDQGRILLEATVPNSLSLTSWLQGFGANVEVVEPASLRNKFISMIKQMSEMYQIK